MGSLGVSLSIANQTIGTYETTGDTSGSSPPPYGIPPEKVVVRPKERAITPDLNSGLKWGSVNNWLEVHAGTIQKVSLGVGVAALATAGALMLFTPAAPAGAGLLGLSVKMAGAN